MFRKFKKGEIIFIFILTANLLLLSFFFSRNWINETCCAFKTHRTYGFPLSVISISKTAQEAAEARKIYSLSNYELLNQGWDLKPGSDNLNFFWALFFDFLFYFIASGIFVGLFNAFIFTITRRIKKGEMYRKYY